MLGFANAQENFYMIVGTIAAALTGISSPIALIFFGQMVSVFTDKSQAAIKGFDFMVKLVIIGAFYWIFSN